MSADNEPAGELVDRLAGAIGRVDTAEVEALLGRGADATAVTDILEVPLISEAVSAGDLGIIRLMCQYGADIDRADSSGRSLLTNASTAHDDPSRVELLLDGRR